MLDVEVRVYSSSISILKVPRPVIAMARPILVFVLLPLHVHPLRRVLWHLLLLVFSSLAPFLSQSKLPTLTKELLGHMLGALRIPTNIAG